MARAPAHRGSKALALRRVALLTVLAFGCATTRPPEPGLVPPGPPPRVALADPQLELWMEGTQPIDPRESDAAYGQAREAMAAAVSGRDGLDAPEPDQLLLVRARAIARTAERKSAQTWSIVFIVFVVAAIIVSSILLSHTKSGPRAVGPGGAHAPAAHGVAPAPAPGFRPPPGPAFVPRPYPPPIGVNVGFALWIPAEPLPPVPWIEPTEAWLARRSWYDSDAVELTVELADPQTGAVSWHNVVRESADPRDPVAVSAVLDRALSGMPFGQRRTPVAPGDAPLPPSPGDLTPSRVPPAPPEDLPPPPAGVPPPPPQSLPPPPPGTSGPAPSPPSQP